MRGNGATLNLHFVDVSEAAGLVSEIAWKYGGPSVSDLNNDGHYDFVLTNHNKAPIQVFLANGDGTFRELPGVLPGADLHGVAAGDYDLDGDMDLLVSLGGGNGRNPQPQRLLRNDDGSFVDVTVEAGVSEMGARGRAVRWVDLDADGDLDFMQVNAAKMIEERTPRNILFENLGDGTFGYRSSPAFEDMDFERVLLTDFDSDGITDLFAFSSYEGAGLWKGVGDFDFVDVSEQWLPFRADDFLNSMAVAQADIDNDGDLDFYLARGKLFSQIADNSIYFDPGIGRLDLRDNGTRKGRDGITLYAGEAVTLSEFWHFPRATHLEYVPIFLGEEKIQIGPLRASRVVSRQDARGFPTGLTETGWYLGHLGDGRWRLEWVLAEDELAWDLRASVGGLSGYEADWTPQGQGPPDILLRNDGTHLTDISQMLPEESSFNNWGVSTGDFDNDGFEDFFVYRFGELRKRIPDVLLMNNKMQSFQGVLALSATTELGRESHGDMGTAFDYNLDGRIDLLNGDEDSGQWHLYENQSKTANFLLVRVGYSDRGVDPLGATISVASDSFRKFKLIGSSSATHSQSVLNIAHFGLGEDETVERLNIRWRDGSQATLRNIAVNQLVEVGSTGR